jgi:hypothetical protein
MRVCVEGHFLRCCKASTAESMGQSFAGSSPLIVAFSCSTTFRSYHLGKNEDNLMAKKGCGTGTRTTSSSTSTSTSTGVGSLQCMHSSSLPVIFNVASQILRRRLLHAPTILSRRPALQLAYARIQSHFILPFPSLMTDCPDSVPAFLTLVLTLHATCDLLHLCIF